MIIKRRCRISNALTLSPNTDSTKNESLNPYSFRTLHILHSVQIPVTREIVRPHVA